MTHPLLGLANASERTLEMMIISGLGSVLVFGALVSFWIWRERRLRKGNSGSRPSLPPSSREGVRTRALSDGDVSSCAPAHRQKAPPPTRAGPVPRGADRITPRQRYAWPYCWPRYWSRSSPPEATGGLGLLCARLSE